jgi:site-specific recombinase XerD
VSESLRIEALECSEKLETIGSTLRQATSFFLDHFHRTNRSCTVNAAIAELCKARQIDGCSKRYLDDLRVRLNRFAADFGEEPIAGLTTGRIDDWLRALMVGGVTRKSYRRRLSTLFNFARRRGYMEANPVRDVERANENPEPVGILTVEEAQSLLANASFGRYFF